jgi:lipoprotein NlpI
MRYQSARFLTVALLAGTAAGPVLGDAGPELLRRAKEAWDAGNRDRALDLAGKAVAADPKDPRGYLFLGQFHDALRRYGAAVADFDRCLELDPKLAEAYDRRGSTQFKRGKFAESVADFDSYLALRPADGPGHWRRGISLYYLGRFDEGRRQFAGYAKVDGNDVENAVWHYLCAARADGEEKARAGMLKIGRDRRVPMMVVYDLFRGRAEPADVLRAAEEGKAPADERRRRLFYAHLYLGLYQDSRGDRKRALEHLELAAGRYADEGYMSDVARVHRDLLRRAEGPK